MAQASIGLVAVVAVQVSPSPLVTVVALVA
jgi:hypothetical protein